MSSKTTNNVEACPPKDVEYVIRLRCPANSQPAPDVRLANLLKRVGRDHGMRCTSVETVQQ